MKIKGGYTSYGQYIGILMMDTVFPRLVGDLGNARTFNIPVKYYTVRNVSTDKLNASNAEEILLKPFIEAAIELEKEGCRAITTSCSFLTGFQKQLADAVHIPVFTNTLMLAPFIHTMLNSKLKIGIFTERADLIHEDYFKQLGWSSNDIPVSISGMAEDSPFAKLFILDNLEEDFEVLEECIKELTLRHMEQNPDTGAIILECTNFSPFTNLIQDISGVPVFGINQLLEYIDSCISAPKYY
jgi:Asp/Glu/hydantoin racemase